MANILIRNFSPSYIRNIRCFSSSFSLNSDKVPEEMLPKNILQDYTGAHLQPKGLIYDKRPFKVHLKGNKKYAWCTCGHSKSQPFCDGSHRIPNLKITLEPIIFMVEETKDYWLCNCKHSEHRPFCDGTHKSEEIQSYLRHYKIPVVPKIGWTASSATIFYHATPNLENVALVYTIKYLKSHSHVFQTHDHRN